MRQIDLIPFLNSSKGKILHIILILFSLRIAHTIYGKSVKSLASLTEEKEIELKKNETLKDIQNTQKKVDGLMQMINKKDVTLIMDKLGDIAKESFVKIVMLKLNPEKDFPAYTQHSFILTVDANNYHDIGKFITKIESQSDMYQVESCSIKTGAQRLDNSQTKLTMELKITTILIKK